MSSMPPLIYWVTGLTGQGHHMAISIGTLVAFTTLQQQLFRPPSSFSAWASTSRARLSCSAGSSSTSTCPSMSPSGLAPIAIQGRARATFALATWDSATPARAVRRCAASTSPSPGRRPRDRRRDRFRKTTLSYLIPRLYDVTSGGVTIDGVDVRDMPFDALAATVGVVSQETYLFHASVAENLRFAKPDATDEELVAAARVAQIHDHLTSLPTATTPSWASAATGSPGGEKQRLAIARAVLRDPPVLVLDERPVPWTRRPSRRSRRPSTPPARAAPRSPSRTACSTIRTRTRSSSWTMARSPSVAATPNCSPAVATTPP